MEPTSESDKNSSATTATPTSSVNEPTLPQQETEATTPQARKPSAFTGPTLQIPVPQVHFGSPSGDNMTGGMYPNRYSPNTAGTPYNMNRKASQFMFNQFNGIRDFTMTTAKSGLGLGEKTMIWIYSKFSHLSRQWFTHFFLTFVIVVYTVGGALMFQSIEGSNEERIVEIDIRAKRRVLIEELRNLSVRIPNEQSIGEWHGIATKKLEDFEDYIIENSKNHQLIVANHGDKIWTFWNAVVYCSTIYTTIATRLRNIALVNLNLMNPKVAENQYTRGYKHSPSKKRLKITSLRTMDSTHASNANVKTENLIENDPENVSMAKIQAMVTPEQVLSASVARRRRTLTRKRSTSATRYRSQTPGRNLLIENTSDSEDIPIPRPKTPERRKKRVSRTTSNTSSRVLTSDDSEAIVEARKDGEIPKVNNNDSKDVVKESHSDKEESVRKRVLKPISRNKSDTIIRPTDDETVEYNKNADKVAKTAKNVELNKAMFQEEFINKLEETNKAKPDIKASSNPDSRSSLSKEIVTPQDKSTNEKSKIPIKTKVVKQPDKIDNIISSTREELLNVLQQAKSSIVPPSATIRRKKLEKSAVKRSQSTPSQLTEKELLESFRLAQIASAERDRKLEQEKRSQSARKYSSDSHKSTSSTARPVKTMRNENGMSNKAYRDEVSKLLEMKRKLRESYKSNKIIEVLDPKTSKVIATKDVGFVHRLQFMDCVSLLYFYSPISLLREFRKYKLERKLEYEKIRKQRKVCINHLLLMIIFCGLGGIIFKYVEGAFENFYKCGVKRVKRDFIDNLWQRSHNLREDEWKSLARNKLRNFEEELHTAHEAGMHDYSGQKSWSFLNGIVYCLTIVTTIGYGHLYPTTTTGQALTIAYALIGIPLFLIILTDFGKLFTRCIKFLWSFVRRLYYTGSCKKVRKTAHVQDIFKGAQMMYDLATFRRPSSYDPTSEVPPDQIDQVGPSPGTGTDTTPATPAISNFEIDDEFNLPISVAILLLVLYILLGAVLFSIWERWDFFTAFYFVFVSMSTIGFGDYVPRHPIFMIVSIVYLVFGLALMSMCINVVQVKLNDTFNQASAKIGATIGLNVAEDGSSVLNADSLPIINTMGSLTNVTLPIILTKVTHDESQQQPE